MLNGFDCTAIDHNAAFKVILKVTTLSDIADNAHAALLRGGGIRIRSLASSIERLKNTMSLFLRLFIFLKPVEVLRLLYCAPSALIEQFRLSA